MFIHHCNAQKPNFEKLFQKILTTRQNSPILVVAQCVPSCTCQSSACIALILFSPGGSNMAKRFLMAMLLLCLMMPAWAQSKPATVTIWGWRAQDVDVWKSVETALKAKGEQITIKYEVFPPTEYDSKLLVSLQGGVGPDLMYTRRLPGARTQALIDNSYLVPLDSSVDLSNFDNVSLSFIRSNNKTWGFLLQTRLSAFSTTRRCSTNTNSKSRRPGMNSCRLPKLFKKMASLHSLSPARKRGLSPCRMQWSA